MSNSHDDDPMHEEEEEEQRAQPASAAPAASSSSSSSAAGKKKRKKSKKKAAAAAEDDDDAMDVEKTAGQKEAEAWLAGLSESDILNPALLDPSAVSKLRDEFQSAAPFRHLVLRDVLDSSFARTLQNEVKGLDFFLKSSDLFEFAQSSDLKSVESPLITKIKSILYGKTFRQLLSDISGIDLGELEHSVDMSANVYGDTNTLLCHDDELHGRRIAYILYEQTTISVGACTRMTGDFSLLLCDPVC